MEKLFRSPRLRTPDLNGLTKLDDSDELTRLVVSDGLTRLNKSNALTQLDQTRFSYSLTIIHNLEFSVKTCKLHNKYAQRWNLFKLFSLMMTLGTSTKTCRQIIHDKIQLVNLNTTLMLITQQ